MGQVECQEGSEVDTCDPFAGAQSEGPPSDETCSDQADNDCDGQTDGEDKDCLENVNDPVSAVPLPSSYSTSRDATGCPTGFVGIFSFDAGLINEGADSLSSIIYEVAQLTGGNLLQNADGGPGGEGAVMTVPLTGQYSDGELAPGETVDVQFKICLKELKPFSFFVDVFGVVD